MKSLYLAASAAVLAVAAPASAQSSYSDFENVPGGPSNGTFTFVTSADGWTGGPNKIELQNNVAGTPARPPVGDGGNVFVELDTDANSYMYRTLTAGWYTLDYLYSPRPGVAASSNPIAVTLNGVELFYNRAAGGADTSWSQINVARFYATAGSELRFAADGTSDSFGGYVDNINISAVPEPATWALMILGFGAVGGAMRRRSARKLAIA